MQIQKWIQSASESSATQEKFTARAKLVKLAAMITALACIILLALLPKLLTLAIALPTLYLCYEGARVADNFAEIINGTIATPLPHTPRPARRATNWAPLSRLLFT